MEFYYANGNKLVDISLDGLKNIGVLLSGGVDSGLLLYMITKTAMAENTGIKIYTITGESLLKPFNIKHSSMVIDTVKALTGYNKVIEQLIFPYRSHLNVEQRIEVMTYYTRLYIKHFNLDMLFEGKTKNPPVTVSELLEGRELDRDDPEGQGLKLKSIEKRLAWPLLYCDKRDIADLYKNLGITESLLPNTRSCEGNLEVTDNLKKQCGVCWWCRERKWAFGEGK
jgi:hypothetical protein